MCMAETVSSIDKPDLCESPDVWDSLDESRCLSFTGIVREPKLSV